MAGPRAHDTALQPQSHRIPPCQQRAACRGTDGLHVELVELNAAFCEFVDVRCGDLAAMVAHIAPAEIVGHHQHNVRPLLRRDDTNDQGSENQGQHKRS